MVANRADSRRASHNDTHAIPLFGTFRKSVSKPGTLNATPRERFLYGGSQKTIQRGVHYLWIRWTN